MTVLGELTDAFMKQLDDLIDQFEKLRAGAKHDDLSDIPDTVAIALATRSFAAIERIGGRQSPYFVRAEEIRTTNLFEQRRLTRLAGVSNRSAPT